MADRFGGSTSSLGKRFRTDQELTTATLKTVTDLDMLGYSIRNADEIEGTLTTAAQPNITSLGAQIADLDLGGNDVVNAGFVAGVLTTATQPNITSLGAQQDDLDMDTHDILRVGNLEATTVQGTLSTAAQPNITSIGTLVADLSFDATHDINAARNVIATTSVRPQNLTTNLVPTVNGVKALVDGSIEDAGAGNGSFKIRSNLIQLSSTAGLVAAAVDGATKQVTIGSDTHATSAQLQIVSTTRGFLPPKMDTTQKNAVSSPVDGLELYDTTLKSPCLYTNSAWSEANTPQWMFLERLTSNTTPGVIAFPTQIIRSRNNFFTYQIANTFDVSRTAYYKIEFTAVFYVVDPERELYINLKNSDTNTTVYFIVSSAAHLEALTTYTQVALMTVLQLTAGVNYQWSWSSGTNNSTDLYKANCLVTYLGL